MDKMRVTATLKMVDSNQRDIRVALLNAISNCPLVGQIIDFDVKPISHEEAGDLSTQLARSVEASENQKHRRYGTRGPYRTRRTHPQKPTR